MKEKVPLKYGIGVLFILQIVGMVGMMTPHSDWFVQLTPVNLMITLGILLYYQEGITNTFIAVTSFIVISSYFLEVVGVNTGVPFGEYAYGEALGWKWKGTPFLIGVNWLFMTYCGSLLMRNVTKHALINALLTGIGVTAFDFIMEPVAINYDFWSWADVEVPIQNYLTWMVASFIYSMIIYTFLTNTKNRIAVWILAAQSLFFISLYIYLKA